jgi:hypothetical protein
MYTGYLLDYLINVHQQIVVVFFVFNDLRRAVVVRFVDILEIVAYHYLSCLFDHSTSVISWQSVLLVEGTGVAGENQRPAASH